jgi:hypothetical protein
MRGLFHRLHVTGFFNQLILIHLLGQLFLNIKYIR